MTGGHIWSYIDHVFLSQFIDMVLSCLILIRDNSVDNVSDIFPVDCTLRYHRTESNALVGQVSQTVTLQC